MSDLTNGEKISIMELAHRVVRDDEAIKDQPKDKNVVGLYHAMIKAITGESVGSFITITGVEEHNGTITIPTTDSNERPVPV